MACDPACVKIIIDTGGRLARAGRFIAEAGEEFARAFRVANDSGDVDAEKREKLHAYAELDCHRAKLILKWAEEIHQRGVDELTGGEYAGAWEVDGVSGIRKRE